MRREVESPTPAWLTRTQRDLKRLGWFYHYDLSAVMGFPRLHLLDREGWLSLLPGLAVGAAALDVGAGSGQLLRDFSPLFDTIVATELSTPLIWRLRLAGAHAIKTDVITRDSLGRWWVDFDVVFVLNVIDRCKDPAALLRQATAALRPGGRLVLSVPLPWEQLDAADLAAEPQTTLAVEGESWGAAASQLLQVLSGLGLRAVRLVRAPYWSTGSEVRPVLALDAAIVVLERAEG